jgi:phytoene/squalene synthetase
MQNFIDLNIAYEKCQKLANEHYENFPVAKMVPKAIRKHVAAVYAFARTADDIADEGHESIPADSPLRVEELQKFESQLDLPQEELDPKWIWIFVALADTIEKFSIPSNFLKTLLAHFRKMSSRSDTLISPICSTIAVAVQTLSVASCFCYIA